MQNDELSGTRDIYKKVKNLQKYTFKPNKIQINYYIDIH